jgi:4a-hydroxytetrahydrobiopterin dehydratase
MTRYTAPTIQCEGSPQHCPVGADSFFKMEVWVPLTPPHTNDLGVLSMAQLLSESEIQTRLNHLSGWTLQGKEIQTVRRFKDFIEAMNFVNRLVAPAEAAGHHPDIAISYNRVTISLTTHDSGGLTDKDFALAEQISNLA